MYSDNLCLNLNDTDIYIRKYLEVLPIGSNSSLSI